jgi:predicted acyltransferase
MEKPARLVSLDQFRGYTVAGMFVVNWLGAFAITPEILKHHRTWCSYADTIMPQFFFAAGFALRLVYLRNAEKSGAAAAHLRAVQRGLGLFVFGVIFYSFGSQWKEWAALVQDGWGGFFSLKFWAQPFQALVHIAVTSLWLVPVLARGAGVRIAFAAASAGLHLWLSQVFWFEKLIQSGVIDGGPLGFLTWTLPTVAGTLAYDAVRAGWKMPRLAASGAVLMVAGYALSCLANGGGWAVPPFFDNTRAHDLWTMSQKAGSTSYLLFSAGFSLALYAAFRVLCDFRGWRLTLFHDLGSNALAAYVLHMLVMAALMNLSPKDSPAWWALGMGALHFGLIWWMVRWLNAKGLYLRL